MNLRGQSDALKPASVESEEALAGPGPERPGPGYVQGGDSLAFNTFRASELVKRDAVVAEQSILCADPQIARAVLNNAFRRQICKATLLAEIVERIPLCKRRSCNDGSRKRGDRHQSGR